MILDVIELAYVVRAVSFFAYLLFPVVPLTQRWVMQRRSLAIAIAWRL